MDGLSRMAGAGLVIPLVERVPDPTKPEGFRDETVNYTLSPMRLYEYALAEAEYLKQRRTPIDAVMPMVEKLLERKLEKQANFLLEKAYADQRNAETANLGRPSIKEMQAWLDSMPGLLFTVWLCLKQNHPDISMSKVEQIVTRLGEDQMKALRDRASATDSLGNSIGPLSAGATEAGGQSLGGESTATLPTPTGGAQTPSTA